MYYITNYLMNVQKTVHYTLFDPSIFLFLFVIIIRYENYIDFDKQKICLQFKLSFDQGHHVV
jgi:hypothetical protein